MNYRIRWQQRRREEARKRLFVLVGGVVATLVVVAALMHHYSRGRVWLSDFHAHGAVLFTESDGVLFCASPARRAQALDAKTGESIWPSPLKGMREFGVPPAVWGDKVVYVNDSGRISTLKRATGEVLWEAEIGHPIRCPVFVDGQSIYVGADDGNVYALDLDDGVEVWRARVDAPVNSGFALVGDHLVFGTADGRFAALDRKAGDVIHWKDIPVELPILALPVVAGDDVIIGTDGGRAYLTDPGTGAIRARIEMPESGMIRSAPLVDAATIYAATTDGWIVAGTRGAVARRGTLQARWMRDIGNSLSAGPVMDDNYIYCGNGTRYLLALSKRTGRIRRRWQCPARVRGSLAVTAGLLIAGTEEGQVVAFRAPAR